MTRKKANLSGAQSEETGVRRWLATATGVRVDEPDAWPGHRRKDRKKKTLKLSSRLAANNTAVLLIQQKIEELTRVCVAISSCPRGPDRGELPALRANRICLRQGGGFPRVIIQLAGRRLTRFD